MPELPEIETIRRDLEISVTGERTARVEVLDSRLMKKSQILEWNKVLAGQVWRSFSRQGKYLFANFDNGWRAGFHMRMTGQLIVDSDDSASKPRMLIHFESGKKLGFYDQRRFGEAWLLAPGKVWHTDSPPG